jgi:transcriptional regulator with XRE-family HTH domain
MMAARIPDNVRNEIADAWAQGLSAAEVAQRYGITPCGVSKIAREKFGRVSEAEFRARRLAGWSKRSAARQAKKITASQFQVERGDYVVKARVGGFCFLLDPQDEHFLYRYCWRASPDGRLSRQIASGQKVKNIYIYHDILGHEPSRAWPVDHINRNPQDNRRANLRVCTASDNARNRAGRTAQKLHCQSDSASREQDHGL